MGGCRRAAAVLPARLLGQHRMGNSQGAVRQAEHPGGLVCTQCHHHPRPSPNRGGGALSGASLPGQHRLDGGRGICQSWEASCRRKGFLPLPQTARCPGAGAGAPGRKETYDCIPGDGGRASWPPPTPSLSGACPSELPAGHEHGPPSCSSAFPRAVPAPKVCPSPFKVQHKDLPFPKAGSGPQSSVSPLNLITILVLLCVPLSTHTRRLLRGGWDVSLHLLGQGQTWDS